MGKIILPGDKVIGVGAQSSPDLAARAAAAGAEIGRAGQQLGQIQANQGINTINKAGQQLKQIAKLNAEYQKEAKKLENNAEYSNLYSQAVSEFNSKMNQRVSNKYDKEGNPTYKSLLEDIKTISDTIKNEYRSKDPEVQSQLDPALDHYLTNKQISALEISRDQQLEHTENSTYQSINEISKVAQESDTNTVVELNNRALEILDRARELGLPENKIDIMKASYFKDVTMGRIQNIISQDPEAAIEIIKTPEASEALSQQEQQALMAHAKTLIRDQINSRTAAIEMDIEEGILDSPIMLAMASTGLPGDTQAILAGKLVDKQKKEEVKLTKQEIIKDRILNNQSLYEFSTRDINEAYKSDIEILISASENRDIPLISKGMVASQYKRPITEFTNEIKNRIQYGDDTESFIEAAETYLKLQKTSPVVLQNISDKVRDSIFFYETLKENTKMSNDQAVAAARVPFSVTIDPQIRSERVSDFKKEFKINNIEEIIRESDDFVDFTVPFTSIGENRIPDYVLNTSTKILRESYLNTGDKKTAIKTFQSWVKDTLGVTQMFGNDTILYHPPEKVFPDIPKFALEEDLQADLDSIYGVNEDGEPNLPGSNIHLESDPNTSGVVINGKLTYSYLLTMEDEGVTVPLLNPLTSEQLRWTPDINAIHLRQIDKAILEAGGEEALREIREGRTPLDKLRGVLTKGIPSGKGVPSK